MNLATLEITEDEAVARLAEYEQRRGISLRSNGPFSLNAPLSDSPA